MVHDITSLTSSCGKWCTVRGFLLNHVILTIFLKERRPCSLSLFFFSVSFLSILDSQLFSSRLPLYRSVSCSLFVMMTNFSTLGKLKNYARSVSMSTCTSQISNLFIFWSKLVFLWIMWIIVGGIAVGGIGFTGSCSRSVEFGTCSADCAVTRAPSHFLKKRWSWLSYVHNCCRAWIFKWDSL